MATSKTRTDAKNCVSELTDIVSQLTSGKRTAKEANRWFQGVIKRLEELRNREETQMDPEVGAYLDRAFSLASKAESLIQRKMNEGQVAEPSYLDPNAKSYQALVHFLIGDPSLTLVKALSLICRATSIDKLGKSLSFLFRENAQELRLVRGCVEAELLAATSSQATMFRRNSINSVCLAQFARSQGGDYLKMLLKPTMDRLSKGSEEYEVDPSKLPNGEVPRKNLVNLAARVEELMNFMCVTVDEMPRQLGFACCVLADVVSRTYPDAKYTAVAGFLMLRFICPALAAPESAAGLQGPPAERRRGLLLLSKLVINLANGVEFGKKESFMAPFDMLLSGTRAKLTMFFDAILEKFSADDDKNVQVPDPFSTLKAEEDHIRTLQAYLNEQGIVDELDDVITRNVKLGLDQHAPLKMRRALNRCPDLPPRIKSPIHSPENPSSPLGSPRGGGGGSAAPSPMASRWSRRSSRNSEPLLTTSGKAIEAPPTTQAPPLPARRLQPSKSSGSSMVAASPTTTQPEEKKSPRIGQKVKALLKPEQDQGYVSTIFSEPFDPNAPSDDWN